ncbi:MAG TPA: tetratricopeptide repeat protein [Bryobacteraceae bacterium]|jgi:tetratricopeptide (TPR) repeat protein|nr:tetratricopeptide repeat protein [Bryobacteraceae bacterium]
MFRSVVVGIVLAAGLLAADATVTEAKKKIADKKYDEAIAQLETAYKSKPNPELKSALANAYLAKGDSFMYNDAVPPRVKYPTALRAYRDVLKYDKENKKAQQNIATIEGIYKSMGRPVPQ